MKKYSKKKYMEVQSVDCFSCKEIVSINALNTYFGATFIDDLNDELLKIQILQDSNMVQCTCKNFLEVVPGSVDYKQKDDEGKVISKQAAEHMANHRVR